MAVSFKNIQSGIISTINALVGSGACPERQLFVSPAIKEGQKGVIPDYPLVVIGRAPMSHYGISSISGEYFDDNLNLVREVRYKGRFRVKVYGSVDDDVQQIAQEIRDTFMRTYGRSLLHQNIGAGLLGISAPDYTQLLVNTDYQDVSSFVIELSITDVFVEDDPNCPETGSIESIIVDGELYENEEDVDPLTTQSSSP